LKEARNRAAKLIQQLQIFAFFPLLEQIDEASVSFAAFRSQRKPASFAPPFISSSVNQMFLPITELFSTRL
jgi:hypothetical protein